MIPMTKNLEEKFWSLFYMSVGSSSSLTGTILECRECGAYEEYKEDTGLSEDYTPHKQECLVLAFLGEAGYTDPLISTPNLIERNTKE